jgi:hypothetical protein
MDLIALIKAAAAQRGKPHRADTILCTEYSVYRCI